MSEKADAARRKNADNAKRIEKYQFKKGVSGNPGGRPKKKPFTDAIMEAIEKDPKLLPSLVKAMVKETKAGNANAFKALRDTVQGKPLQEIEFHGDLTGGLNSENLEHVDRAIAELLNAAGGAKSKPGK